MDSDMSDPDVIQYLETQIVDDGATHHVTSPDPIQHSLQWSAVRPFFCCGSQLSLVSVTDPLDPSTTDPLDPGTTGTEAMAYQPVQLSLGPSSLCCACTQPTSRKRKENVKQKTFKRKIMSFRGKFCSRLIGTHGHELVTTKHTSNCPCSACSQSNSLLSHSCSADSHHSDSQYGAALPGEMVDNSMSVPPVVLEADEIARSARQGSRRRWSSHGILGIHRASSQQLDPPAFPEVEEAVYGDASAMRLQIVTQDLDTITRHDRLAGFLALHRGATNIVAHSQVEYEHCLVPDIRQITKCSYYWGVMDRYEAEALLDGKPEGSFLLRDSAQEDFLFSVSFRRYNRSLHARIEQWNHTFSFDAHDPAVFSCDSVVGLIEHYKDPQCCMFFEPMLTLPLNRKSCFPLQHLCRASICSNVSYGDINALPLPSSLKEYLKYYHYKQKVRVRRLDIPVTTSVQRLVDRQTCM